jgi:hypothetical protein
MFPFSNDIHSDGVNLLFPPRDIVFSVSMMSTFSGLLEWLFMMNWVWLFHNGAQPEQSFRDCGDEHMEHSDLPSARLRELDFAVRRKQRRADCI